MLLMSFMFTTFFLYFLFLEVWEFWKFLELSEFSKFACFSFFLNFPEFKDFSEFSELSIFLVLFLNFPGMFESLVCFWTFFLGACSLLFLFIFLICHFAWCFISFSGSLNFYNIVELLHIETCYNFVDFLQIGKILLFSRFSTNL